MMRLFHEVGPAPGEIRTGGWVADWFWGSAEIAQERFLAVS